MNDEKKQDPYPDLDLGIEAPLARPSLRTPPSRLQSSQAPGVVAAIAREGASFVTTRHVPPASDADDELVGTTIDLPLRVRRELDQRAAQRGRRGVPIKILVLEALRQAGFTSVKDGDLEDKRGSFLKEAAARRRAEQEGRGGSES